MTLISMDPEAMEVHARTHEEVAEFIGPKLEAVPAAVDGGIGSDSVVAIMARVATSVDALYRVNGRLAEILRAVVADHTALEQDIIDDLKPVADELEEF